MKKKSCIEILEDMTLNIEKLDDSFILIKEQISEFTGRDRVQINFKDCHVAICPNGGLIAICKKKGFLDIKKGTKLNDNIVIMHQDAKKKYLIPINWKYTQKYVVHLEFNDKEQLYAICNDWTIMKIDFLSLSAETKTVFHTYESEYLSKCKLFQNGFIGLTVEGNIYYVKNIKQGTPELFFPMKSLLDFSNDIDFVLLPSNVTKSKNLEMFITNEKGIGLIHVLKSEDGRFGIRPVEGNVNVMAVKNVHILKKDKLEIFTLDTNDAFKDKNYQKDYKYFDNMWQIAAIALSPSKTKIAFYDTRGYIYIFKSELTFIEKIQIKKGDNFSKIESEELDKVISFEEGCQFLFFGEDAIALSGKRFIIILHENNFQNIYKIVDGYELEASQGLIFSKCIPEFDGLRYVTNEGIFLITTICKELYDICSPFSKSESKKLLKIYETSLVNVLNKELTIREINNLSNAVTNLQIAAANIFWFYDYIPDNNNNNDFKKEMTDLQKINLDKKKGQLFLLEASQFGKGFLQSEKFNFDMFLEFCKDIRIVNNLRNHQAKPKLITYKEYKNIDAKNLIKIVMRNLNFGMAFEISRYLGYNENKVFKRYAIGCMKKSKNNIDSKEEAKLFDILQRKFMRCPNISYIKLAKKAFKYNQRLLGLKFLEQEKSTIARIPQYIDLQDWNTALTLAKQMNDHNIIITVVDKIYNKVEKNTFLLEVSKHPNIRPIVIDYLKQNAPTLIETYLKELKNPEELMFYYIEKYFLCSDYVERKKCISHAKENEKLITNAINPNFEHKFYKNYLDQLDNSLNFKIDMQVCDKEKSLVSNPENLSIDISLYDAYKMGVKGEKYNWIENQNKHFGLSNEGMALMRINAYGEMGKLIAIDNLMKKVNNNAKKLGLTYIDLAETFLKFGDIQKAAEMIKSVNDSFYFAYKYDLLKEMGKLDVALEVVISDKNFANYKNIVFEILNKKPELKGKADELLAKYKVSLK